MEENNHSDREETIAQSWSRLLDCAIHDISSSLSSMRFSAKTLSESFDELKKGYEIAISNNLMPESHETKNFLELTEFSAKRMKESFQIVFDFMNMLYELKKKAITADAFEVLKIQDCLNDVINDYPFKSIQEKSLIQVDIKDNFSFHGDKQFMQYLFAHLIDNALRSITDKGNGNITIWTAKQGDFQELHFKDTGVGISKNSMPRIFDRFFSKRNEQIIPGLGFCRFAVLQQGGDLICESQENEYTHFLLRLKI